MAESYEILIVRIEYHIQKANFMGLKEYESTRLLNEAVNALKKLVDELEKVECKHGKWINHRTIEHDGEWYCSACGNEVTICMCGKDKTWNYPYCPNCGADMRGEK